MSLITASPPAATGEAILPCSTSTPIGVPPAPNALIASDSESSSTRERSRCCAHRFGVAGADHNEPGIPGGVSSSSASRSGSIRWQNPQPGFQNITTVRYMYRSWSATVWPSRSLSESPGAD